MWDDVLLVDFRITASSVDYKYLMNEVFPTYIEAMQAYFPVLSESALSAWFCVEEATCPSTARWVRNAATSACPISDGWRLP